MLTRAARFRVHVQGRMSGAEGKSHRLEVRSWKLEIYGSVTRTGMPIFPPLRSYTVTAE